MQYTIKIPKPCNEKWNEMTSSQKGKFCSNCKEVIFQFYSDQQLLDSIKKSETICGFYRIKSIRNYNQQKKNIF
jgi:hypothetical protein